MNDLLAFFGEFILILAVSGMLSALAPEGTAKKYVQFAISLAVLVSLIGPMLSVVSSLPELLEDAELSVEAENTELKTDLTEAVIAQTKMQMESSIRALLSEKTELSDENIAVTIHVNAEDPGNIKILSVEIGVRGSSVIEKAKIKDMVSDLFLGHCAVNLYDLE